MGRVEVAEPVITEDVSVSEYLQHVTLFFFIK